jgi:ribosomal protein S18 acetylase RimI-like enzyme
MVRLDRGGAEFLTTVRAELAELTGEAIYSPALFPGSTRVWRRAGFGDYSELTVMERSLPHVSSTASPHVVEAGDEPDWETILQIDRAAFEGFWGMSRLGLEEAHQTNQETILLTASTGEAPEGFAIVGSQWGLAYLHRIAVLPERSGLGLGASLLDAALRWGAARGARSMVLNVRDDNRRARALYERSGFTKTGTNLQILRHPRR